MERDEILEMTWGELLDIVGDRDAKTIEAVGIFVGIIWLGLEKYPQGDLHDFLASITASYAAQIVSAKVIGIDDPREFFRECGFNSETIEDMVVSFEIEVELRKHMPLIK